MLDTIDDLEFEAVGSVLADRWIATITGPSPYNGSLPFGFELRVSCDVFDDIFTVSVRHGTDLVARVTSPTHFNREPAICQAIGKLLGMAPWATLPKTTRELANLGYRFISIETGVYRGHTETITILADTISELDAALKLNCDPDCIYDVLDAGADPMRQHITYGRPMEVAKIRQHIREDYQEVLAYMRAYGAY